MYQYLMCGCILLFFLPSKLQEGMGPDLHPDPMSLSLKKLQCILKMEQPMDNDCFNTAVRMLACDEGVLITDPPIHYMDLRFCVSYHNSSFYVALVSTCFNNILVLHSP